MTLDQTLDSFVAEIIRVWAVVMADVDALKILHVAHQPDGRQRLVDAIEAATRGYQPILDSPGQANDQTLLDVLKGLTGPVH